MIETFTTELQALFHEGGWVLWLLVALAFGIAFALISIWQSLRDVVFPSDMISVHLDELEQRLFSKPRRRIPFAFVLISAAPLVGLLGTVSGMFTTFDGMASSTAGSPPAGVISRGVSEALITTQAGLIIGVPAFIVATLLKSKFERLRHHFRRLEVGYLKGND